MAEKEQHDDSAPNAGNRNLEQFICDHYQKQKDAGQLEAVDDLSDKRTEDFFNRAIAESRRMNGEVIKSVAQQQHLRKELGSEMVSEWRDEHAAEVLLPEQAERIRLANQYTDG